MTQTFSYAKAEDREVYTPTLERTLLPMKIAAGMEPLKIRGKCPDLSILGGIVISALIAGKNEIRKEIERKVPALIAHCGYFPSVDHHIPPYALLKTLHITWTRFDLWDEGI